MGILDFFEAHQSADKILQAFSGALCSVNRIISTGKNNGNKNILVLSLHRLGDTVFTIPTIKFLHEKFGADLVIACFPESAEIYKLVFDDLNFIFIDKRELKFGGRIASGELRNKIKGQKPKAVFDLTGTIYSASLLIGLQTENIYGVPQKYFRNLYTYYTEQRTEPHLIDLYFDVVRLIAPEADVALYRGYEAKVETQGRILINPFAGWKAKEWNPEKVLKLAESLSLEYDVALIYEKNNPGGSFFEKFRKNGGSIIETNSFGELIEAIKKSIFLIGSDSGPLYIANMLGISTFTIYSSSNPSYSLPYGNNNRYIAKRLECSPKPGKQFCYTKGGLQGCPSFECMNQLVFEEVYTKVKEFLKELNIKPKNH